MLLEWPSDPRRDLALVETLELLPQRNSRKVWTRLIKMILLVKDPQILSRLQALDALFAQQFTSMTGEWAREKLQKALVPIASLQAQELADEDRQVLMSLGGTQPSKATQRSAEEEELLLRRILEDPEDDAARQVYGDLLLERGHPRGELISLQFHKLSTKLTKPEAKREKELIRDNLEALVGPLVHVIARTGLEFERGFLSSCGVDDYGKEHLLAKVVGHRMWSTVRDLSGPKEIFEHPVMKSLTILGVHSERSESRTECLLKGPTHPKVTHLTCHLRQQADLCWFGESTLFPALTDLRVTSYSPSDGDSSDFLSTPVFQRLERLTVDLPWFWQPLYHSVLAGPLAEVELKLKHQHRLLLLRDADNQVQLTLNFDVGPSKNRSASDGFVVDKLLPILENIDPARIASLTLKPSRKLVDKKAIQRLEKAVAHFSTL